MSHRPRSVDDPRDPAWTLAEAADWLDPPMPLRTLQRLAAQALCPVDERRGGRGRPASRFRFSEILGVHRLWVGRKVCVPSSNDANSAHSHSVPAERTSPDEL